MIVALKSFFLKSKLLEYLIEVFFFADVWYIGYTFLLKFLNKNFPYISHFPVLNQYKGLLNPEPFEVPLYIIFTGSMVLMVFLYYLKLKKILGKLFNFGKSLRVKLFIFILSAMFFFSKLGNYPMGEEKLNLFNWKTLLYLSLIIAISIVISAVNYLNPTKKYVKYLLYSFVLFVVGIITFESKFPISMYDYSYILGPVYEIVKGRTIFTDIISQYGFLTLLILAGLYKLSIINIFYLPAIIWILGIVEYFLCFYLIYKFSKSVAFSIISIFSIITIGYFSLTDLPYFFPQTGPLRWIPMILTVYIFYKFKNIESKMLMILVSFISLLMIDSGIVIILSYLFFLSEMFLSGQISFSKTIKTAMYFFISLVAAFLSINFVNILFGFKNINILSYFILISQYAREGYGMLPIGNFSYLWLVVLVYFGSIVYFIRKKNVRNEDKVILLSANIAIFGSIYFVGRSHPNNLFHISILFLLNFFLLTGNFFSKVTRKWVRFLVLLFVFILFIAFPAYNRQSALAQIVSTNLHSLNAKNIFTPSILEIMKGPFLKNTELINAYIPDKQIIILSTFDTYFLYLVNKQNLITINPQNLITTEKDLKSSVSEAVKLCPKRIVVDCRIHEKCPGGRFNPWEPVVTQGQMLDEIQRACKFVYKEIKCSHWFCIAQAK